MTPALIFPRVFPSIFGALRASIIQIQTVPECAGARTRPGAVVGDGSGCGSSTRAAAATLERKGQTAPARTRAVRAEIQQLTDAASDLRTCRMAVMFGPRRASR